MNYCIFLIKQEVEVASSRGKSISTKSPLDHIIKIKVICTISHSHQKCVVSNTITKIRSSLPNVLIKINSITRKVDANLVKRIKCHIVKAKAAYGKRPLFDKGMYLRNFFLPASVL